MFATLRYSGEAAAGASELNIDDESGRAGTAKVIRIMRASGRERLELQRGGGREPILLTYRVLSSHGRQQLVFFQARRCAALWRPC